MSDHKPTPGRRFAGFIADLCVIAGAGAASYGVWLIHEPYGFICGGFLLMVGGVVAGMRS